MVKERRPPGPLPWQIELGRRLEAEKQERLTSLRVERTKSARQKSSKGDQDLVDPVPAAAMPNDPRGYPEVMEPVPAPAAPDAQPVSVDGVGEEEI